MRTLVIGYGNPSRRDDGVALTIINGLRQRLGLPSLEGNQDGFDDLGGSLDTLFLQQLMPELAETLSAYERVIFLDAHVGVFPEMIRRVEIGAERRPRHGLAPRQAGRRCWRLPAVSMAAPRRRS